MIYKGNFVLIKFSILKHEGHCEYLKQVLFMQYDCSGNFFLISWGLYCKIVCCLWFFSKVSFFMHIRCQIYARLDVMELGATICCRSDIHITKPNEIFGKITTVNYWKTLGETFSFFCRMSGVKLKKMENKVKLT